MPDLRVAELARSRRPLPTGVRPAFVRLFALTRPKISDPNSHLGKASSNP